MKKKCHPIRCRHLATQLFESGAVGVAWFELMMLHKDLGEVLSDSSFTEIDDIVSIIESSLSRISDTKMKDQLKEYLEGDENNNESQSQEAS